MQELFKPNELHSLHDPGIADQRKGLVLSRALLGELNEHTKTRGIDEIDLTEIDQQWLARAAVGRDELAELLVGIGIQLAGEPEQLAVRLLLESPTQGHGESLQVGDGSCPPCGYGRKCRESCSFCSSFGQTASGVRRAFISAVNRAKW